MTSKMTQKWTYSLVAIFVTFTQIDAINNSIDMTGLFGRPIGHKTNLLTAGFHGPTLLQDVQFLEEMAHFDRERIPERVVHAKGSGAFGEFRVTNPDIKRYTKASLFDRMGKTTEVAVRFSTVSGEQGSADTVFGDPRGFAVKFYTDEGNWDLVGNNVPMFFIRDSQQFPSLIHANKRNTQTGRKDNNYLWDFNSLRPETLNLITYMYSDFGIPDGFRHMPGFSIHAYKLVNHNNEFVFAKFHWIPNQGIKNIDTDTAAKLRGTDPDYARQDLFDAIANSKYPSWILKIQVINEEMAKKFPFNPFDATKIWPEDKYPLIDVGVMTLNRNPKNFFSEVEQLAFCPANLVPGVEPSPDLLLAGRLFSYSDTQRYRLGANHQLIPVNQAKKKPMAITQRDGPMMTDDNLASLPNYYPNSFSAIKDNKRYMESNFTVSQSMVYRYDDKDDHNYEQPRALYRSFSKDWKDRFHRNVAMAMKGVSTFIRDRQLEHFKKVDPKLAEALKEEMNKLLKKRQTQPNETGSITLPKRKNRKNNHRSRTSGNGNGWIYYSQQ